MSSTKKDAFEAAPNLRTQESCMSCEHSAAEPSNPDLWCCRRYNALLGNTAFTGSVICDSHKPFNQDAQPPEDF